MTVDDWHEQAEDLPLHPDFGWVYRLWSATGRCLYVGQTSEPQPWVRIKVHRTQPWWKEVTRVDYMKVPDQNHLNAVETHFIRKLHPAYNGSTGKAARRAAAYVKAPYRNPLIEWKHR